MKELFRSTREDSIKTVILGFSLIFSSIVYGQQKLAVAISKIDGRAFYSHQGKTKTLKVGTHLPAGSDIFTEEGAQIIFNDYYNHQFILSGSGHVNVDHKKMKLKSGYLWVQSLVESDQNSYQITTANSEVAYSDGEGIISFDPFSGKTQILVLKGEYQFKNILYRENYVSIRDGRFSFISNDVNNGMPRKPTPIGYSSFQKITGLFQGVKSLDDQAEEKRVANVKTNIVPDVRQVYVDVPKQDLSFEQAITNSRERLPSSENVVPAPKANTEKLLKSYLSKLAKKKPEVKKVEPASVVEKVKKTKPQYKKKSNSYKGYKKNSVKVNIYGASVSRQKSKSRMPASAGHEKSLDKKTTVYGAKKATKYDRAPASLGNMVPKVYDRRSSGKTFESKLIKEYKHQKRHSDDMNALIDKLQSVDMDYQKDY